MLAIILKIGRDLLVNHLFRRRKVQLSQSVWIQIDLLLRHLASISGHETEY